MNKSSRLSIFLKYLRWKYFPSQTQKIDRQQHPARLKFYSQFVHMNDLCFDVGANLGNRTEVFLALGTKVVAVEPQPICYKMLEVKFGKKIILIKEALGSKPGEGVIFASETHELSSLSKDWINSVSAGRFKGVRWKEEIHVKINTLDNLIATYGSPSFCKIDVEGFEEEVFKGLSQKIPYISFEYTIPERLENIRHCLTHLSTIGNFDCNFTIGEEMKFVYEDWMLADQMMNTLAALDQQELFGDIYVRFK